MIYSQLNLLDHSTHSVNDLSNEGKADDSSSSAATLKRPLSGYNIFFQLQRKRLIDGDNVRFITLDEAKEFVDSQRIMRNLPQPKRPHRKTHGKIGFREMARSLAEQWKSLSPQQKHVYDTCAAGEKKRYLEEKKLLAFNNANAASTDIELRLAALIPDDNSRDGYGVGTRTVPQIVRMPITRENSRDEEQMMDDNLLHNNDESDDLMESQREILHNTRMIQYQKAKLQRLQQQMEMFAMNQRKLQLMEMMKQQQKQQKRFSMQTNPTFNNNNNWMELMYQQQQQRRSSLMNPFSNNATLFPNTVSSMNDNAMNFSAAPQVDDAPFDVINHDFGGGECSEDYINEVHDLADRTFEGVTDFLSMNNDNFLVDDDFTPLNDFSNIQHDDNNDFIVQEFAQFQDEDNHTLFSR